MKSIYRTVGLGAIAVLAFSGLVATSASAALPEFSVSNAVANVSISTANFETSTGAAWGYRGSSGLGTSISGSKEISNLVLTFSEPLGKGACHNTKEFTLVTNKLHGRLGYINKAKTEVGLLLEPNTQPLVTCTNELWGTQEYRGSVIGRVAPVNTPTKELTVTFQYLSHGKQLIQKFEGEEVLHSLEFDHEGVKLAMEMTATLTNFKANEKQVSIEVKA